MRFGIVSVLRDQSLCLFPPPPPLFSLTISTSQVDLVEIKKAFLERYHKTLYKMIDGDTSGDYRRLLLAIVGRDV